MLQRISDQFRVLAFTQQSRVVASIEPALYRARKNADDIPTRSLATIARNESATNSHVLLPLAQQIAWNRIGESKSDEIDCASLLQVR
jgi:hypothetical protein